MRGDDPSLRFEISARVVRQGDLSTEITRGRSALPLPIFDAKDPVNQLHVRACTRKWQQTVRPIRMTVFGLEVYEWKMNGDVE